MQLNRSDIDILIEAAQRYLAADNHFKWVLAETFLKARQAGLVEVNTDNEHLMERGNSDVTLTHLEVMLHLIDGSAASKLNNMAYNVSGMEYAKDSPCSQLEWYAAHRAGSVDTADHIAVGIADRYMKTFKPES